MKRLNAVISCALAISVACVLSLVAANRPAAYGALASLEVELPKDERECQGLGFREVSGSFELARPVESVVLTVEVYNDGVKTTPFPRGWLRPGNERQGRFAVLFVDLGSLPTVVNSNDTPLRLAAPRTYYKDWLVMSEDKYVVSSGPVDTDRLLDLESPVEYHVFDRSAGTDDIAPLFAMYAGTVPLNTNEVRTVDELLKRNPKGRLVIASLGFNDHPKFDPPPK